MKYEMITKINSVPEVEKKEVFKASSVEDVKSRVFRKVMVEMEAYKEKMEEFEVWTGFPYSERDVREHNGIYHVSACTCHVYIYRDYYTGEEGELDYSNGREIHVTAKEIS